MLKRTGVFATLEQLTKINALADTARTTPVMALSIKDGLEGNDFASRAWKQVYEAINQAATDNGLPVRDYGIDLETGEFAFIEYED